MALKTSAATSESVAMTAENATQLTRHLDPLCALMGRSGLAGHREGAISHDRRSNLVRAQNGSTDLSGSRLPCSVRGKCRMHSRERAARRHATELAIPEFVDEMRSEIGAYPSARRCAGFDGWFARRGACG